MQIDQQKLEKEALKVGISMLVLFGSQATGKAKTESDYDLAVLMLPIKDIGKNLSAYTETLFFLANVLGIAENKIDLTNLASASPLLQKEIFSEGRLLFGDTCEFASLKAAALRRYIDIYSLRQLRTKMINTKQKILTEKIYG